MGILGQLIMGIKRLAISAGKGVVDPIVAVGKGAVQVAKDNVSSTEGGVGKIDYIRLISFLGGYSFALAYLLGYITVDELKQAIKILLLF